jgi:hypothetical protein
MKAHISEAMSAEDYRTLAPANGARDLVSASLQGMPRSSLACRTWSRVLSGTPGSIPSAFSDARAGIFLPSSYFGFTVGFLQVSSKLIAHRG